MRVGADLDARDDAPALESTRRRAARAEEGGVAADAVVAVSMTRAGGARRGGCDVMRWHAGTSLSCLSQLVDLSASAPKLEAPRGSPRTRCDV